MTKSLFMKIIKSEDILNSLNLASEICYNKEDEQTVDDIYIEINDFLYITKNYKKGE